MCSAYVCMHVPEVQSWPSFTIHPCIHEHLQYSEVRVQCCLLFIDVFRYNYVFPLHCDISEDCQEAQGRAQSDDHGMSPSCTALPSGKCV